MNTEISRRLAALREKQGLQVSRFGAYFAEQREARDKAASKATPTRQVRAGTVSTAAKVPTIAQRIASAKREAKARYENVMASDAVKGRERQASELLMASCDRNAKHKTSAAIIAELRKRPTDKGLDAKIADYQSKVAANKQAEVGAMWDRAYARLSAIGG